MLRILGNGFEHFGNKGQYHIFIDTVLGLAELSNWDFAVLGTGILRNTLAVVGTVDIDNDYVFTWEDGHPYSPDYVSHTFHKLLKKYDLPHIRFHDLRHTCASMLLSEGYGLKDVQEWLGHSDIKMTANIYGHLDIRRKRSIANGLEQALPRLKP